MDRRTSKWTTLYNLQNILVTANPFLCPYQSKIDATSRVENNRSVSCSPWQAKKKSVRGQHGNRTDRAQVRRLTLGKHYERNIVS